jgi:hypothetical protein
VSRNPYQKILFCGSRDWTDEQPIASAIHGLSKGSIVIHGGCRGADMIADKYARARGLHVARVDALWSYYGHYAGPKRNEAMCLLGIDFAFAYPLSGSGTQGMLDLLAQWNVPHYIHGGATALPSKDPS